MVTTKPLWMENKEMDLEKLTQADLREMATKLGVKWDKRVDDADSLRAKIAGKLAAAESEAEESLEFDVTKRAPLEEKWDAGTKKNVKERSDCFGWLHSEGKEPCVSCSHAKWCAPLSEGADEAMKEAALEVDADEQGGGAEFKAKLGEEAEEEADEIEEEEAAKEEEVAEELEVEGADLEVKLDAALGKASLGKKHKKAGNVVGDRPEEKARVLAKKKQKLILTEESEFTLGFDRAYVDEIEDGSLRKVYRKLFREYEGEEITAGVILDAFGIEDDEERVAALSGDLPGLVTKGDFILVG